MGTIAENYAQALSQGEQDPGSGYVLTPEQIASFAPYKTITAESLDQGRIERDLKHIFESGLQPLLVLDKGPRERMEDTLCIGAASTNRTSADAVTFLESMFEKIAENIAGKSFNTHSGMRAGGTTANICYISADPERTLTVANAGDSRTVLFMRDIESGTVAAYRLSYDHKASDPHEQARVEAAGGVITHNETGIRVQNQTTITRGFGNEDIIGLIHTPEITQCVVGAIVDDPRYEVYVCTSCDGLYQAGISEKDFAKVMGAFFSPGERTADSAPDMVTNFRLAKLFSDVARNSGSTDNITISITKLVPHPTKDIIIGIFDGHSGDDRYLGAEIAKIAGETLTAALAPPLRYKLSRLPGNNQPGQGGRGA